MKYKTLYCKILKTTPRNLNGVRALAWTFSQKDKVNCSKTMTVFND